MRNRRFGQLDRQTGFESRSFGGAVAGSSAPVLTYPAARFVDLDFSKLSGANGATIATVADESGNSRTATGVNAPTVQIVNGVKTARYESGSYLSLGDYSSLITSTVFRVPKVDENVPASEFNSGFWRLHGADDSTLNTHYRYPSDGNWYEAGGSTVRRNLGNIAANLTNWHVIAQRNAPNDWRTFIDGTGVAPTDTSNTVDFSTNCRLGRALDGGNAYVMRGNDARFIVFDSALNDAAIAAFTAQLMNYYAALFA